MSPEQEQALLREIQANARQFGTLFDEYYKPIFGYVFRRVADYDLAKDIVAETFLKALLKINHFKWRGVSLAAWLYRIATNEVNQYYRRQKYRPEMQGYLMNGGLPVSVQQPERELLEAELERHREFREVQAKLKLLPIKYQEVLALKYFEGKSNRQISEVLGKPEGTVKSLLSRGLEKLKKLCNPNHL